MSEFRGLDLIERMLSEVSRIVIGKDEIKKLILLALLSEGHILIEGIQGTAKTTLAHAFSQVIGGKFKRIQGTPDMLPADILGFYLHSLDGTSRFMPGPIFANVVLADELNRVTPRTQAAFLEAMQEKQVTIELESHQLGEPFLVIASQMAYGSAGTVPLTEVQIDRFMFRAWSDFPSEQEEFNIVREIDRITETRLEPVVTAEDIARLRQAVKKVHIDDNILKYIIQLINRLRTHPDLRLGPSTRGSIAIFKGVRALAYTQGRDFVIPDDVKYLLLPALYHRCWPTAEAEMDRVSLQDLITSTTDELAVPRV